MVRVKASHSHVSRAQASPRVAIPAVERCPGGVHHGERGGRSNMVHTQDTDRRLEWSSTHLYHWRSFMMLSLKGNICLPTKNYNSKNGIWYNYNL